MEILVDILHRSHAEKVILYVLGTIEELKAKGLMEGGRLEPTPKGISAFDQLMASGFRPTPEEIRDVLRYMRQQAGGP